MADGGLSVGMKEVQSFELRIQWIPETGQLSMVGSPMDDVMRFGILEMAKVAMIRQGGQQQPVIVPGRFVS